MQISPVRPIFPEPNTTCTLTDSMPAADPLQACQDMLSAVCCRHAQAEHLQVSPAGSGARALTVAGL